MPLVPMVIAQPSHKASADDHLTEGMIIFNYSIIERIYIYAISTDGDRKVPYGGKGVRYL